MSGSTTYYVRALDSSGNPIISATGQQWFDVSSANLNLSNPISAPVSNPLGTQTGSQPFSLSLTGLGGLDNTALLPDRLSGAALSQIEVAGYNGSTLVSDDIFGNVEVETYSVTNTATPSFSFNYGEVQQTLYTQSAGGQAVQQSQSDYDYGTKSADYTPAVTAPTNNVPAASAGFQPTQYALSFGTSTGDHPAWERGRQFNLVGQPYEFQHHRIQFRCPGPRGRWSARHRRGRRQVVRRLAHGHIRRIGFRSSGIHSRHTTEFRHNNDAGRDNIHHPGHRGHGACRVSQR